MAFSILDYNNYLNSLPSAKTPTPPPAPSAPHPFSILDYNRQNFSQPSPQPARPQAPVPQPTPTPQAPQQFRNILDYNNTYFNQPAPPQNPFNQIGQGVNDFLAREKQMNSAPDTSSLGQLGQGVTDYLKKAGQGIMNQVVKPTVQQTQDVRQPFQANPDGSFGNPSDIYAGMKQNPSVRPLDTASPLPPTAKSLPNTAGEVLDPLTVLNKAKTVGFGSLSDAEKAVLMKTPNVSQGMSTLPQQAKPTQGVLGATDKTDVASLKTVAPQVPTIHNASQATTEAIKNGAHPAILDRARQFLNHDDYIGFCESFIEAATGSGWRGVSAIDAWNRQQGQAQTDFSRIKPGDVVYFAADASNKFFGHTGIYQGGGSFISATDSGVKPFDLNDWMQRTGQKLLGFVPSNGVGSKGASPIVPGDQSHLLGWVEQQVKSAATNAFQNTNRSSGQPPANQGTVQQPLGQSAYANQGIRQMLQPPTQEDYPTAQNPMDSAMSSPSFVTGTPEWIQSTIQNAARKYNIPAVMLSALIKKESGFNPGAISQVGGRGLAQIMPDVASKLGINPHDPQQAIEAAAKYLRQNWDRFGKPDLALAAYNSGPANVQAFGGVPPFKQTRDYVKHIMDMSGQVHGTAYDPILAIQNQARK